MAYPSVSFRPTTPFAGLQPIAQASTTQMHPIGTIVRAQDTTYGEGEFIYLLGVASTAKGDVVCYRSDTGVTVRAVHGGATSVGSVAVAMSASVASNYGWYCISGSVPVNSGTVAANGQAYLTSTAGQVDDAVVSGDEIGGFLFKSADSSGFATGQLSRPALTGAGGSSGTNTGDVTLANVGSTPAAQGASLSGQVLTLQPADGTRPGVISTSAQTMGAGAKTFSGGVVSDTMTTATAATLALTSSVADGSSAVAVKSNSSVALTTGGASIHDFQNNGVRKAYINKDGAIYSSAGRYNVDQTNGDLILGDATGDIWVTVKKAGLDFTTGNTLTKTLKLPYSDSTGTPGDATINKPIGRSAVANGATTCTITNSVCTSTSVVLVTPEDGSGTTLWHKVVPGSGSFVVTVGVDPGATWKFRWAVLNGA